MTESKTWRKTTDETFHGYKIVAEEAEEVPNMSGYLLYCPQCDKEERFVTLKLLKKSEWVGIDKVGPLLINGYIGHEGYCPNHSFGELDEEIKNLGFLDVAGIELNFNQL